mgnify:CR=1 FL=1
MKNDKRRKGRGDPDQGSKTPKRKVEKNLFQEKNFPHQFNYRLGGRLAFIEKQENIVIKIETNINQIARIVNGQKFISQTELSNFQNQLKTIVDLKEKQNEIFLKIYSLIANDR